MRKSVFGSSTRRSSGNEERKAAVVAGPTEATRRVCAAELRVEPEHGQAREHRVHRVRAGEDHPVVAVERFERFVQRADVPGRDDVDRGHLEDGRAHRLEPLRETAGLALLAGDHDAAALERAHGSAFDERGAMRARAPRATRSSASPRPRAPGSLPRRSPRSMRIRPERPRRPRARGRCRLRRRALRAGRCSRRRAPRETPAPPRPLARSPGDRAARVPRERPHRPRGTRSRSRPAPAPARTGAGRGPPSLRPRAPAGRDPPSRAGSRRTDPRAGAAAACRRCRAGPRAGAPAAASEPATGA